MCIRDRLKDSYFCANYAKGSSPEFEDAYKSEYGKDYPNGFAPLGYDAAKTVVYGVQAAEDAGLESGTEEYKPVSYTHLLAQSSGLGVGNAHLRLHRVHQAAFHHGCGLRLSLIHI